MLLNPFLLILYLTDLVQDLDRRTFRLVLVRAGLISAGIFAVFAVLGDALFSEVLQARFASFQIFGGVVFLLIGIQFIVIGLLGEMQIRTYYESQNKPIYFIKEIVENRDEVSRDR